MDPAVCWLAPQAHAVHPHPTALLPTYPCRVRQVEASEQANAIIIESFAPVMHWQPAVAALIAVAVQHMPQLTSWEIRPGLSVGHERYNRCGSRCLRREAAD